MQNVVICGASQGIGLELAKQLAELGHKVIALTRNIAPLEDVRDNYKGQIIPIAFDLNSLKYPTNLLEEKIFPHAQAIDVLINNAGILKKSTFESSTFNDVSDMFNVNVICTGLLIQRLMPWLRKSESGHVINITSMGGFQGSVKFPELSWYSASKAALASLNEVLAEEYKHTRIHFNSLALGAVQTEMLDKAFPSYQAPVQAREMASFIIDFALNGQRFFNGKTIPVSSSTP